MQLQNILAGVALFLLVCCMGGAVYLLWNHISRCGPNLFLVFQASLMAMALIDAVIESIGYGTTRKSIELTRLKRRRWYGAILSYVEQKPIGVSIFALGLLPIPGAMLGVFAGGVEYPIRKFLLISITASWIKFVYVGTLSLGTGGFLWDKMEFLFPGFLCF